MRLVRLTFRENMEVGSRVIKSWTEDDPTYTCTFRDGYYELSELDGQKVWLIPMSWAVGEFERDEGDSEDEGDEANTASTASSKGKAKKSKSVGELTE